MTTETAQLTRWKGQFGDDYIARNPVTDDGVRHRTRALAAILQAADGNAPRSILEIGPNQGGNLRALKNITDAELHALEPNKTARQTIIDQQILPAAYVHEGTASHIPLPDASIDLVFTAGVLIHIAPDDAEAAYREIYRVSRKYILCMEYFSQKLETVHYHGNQDMLWKGDFGGLWLDLFPTLDPIGEGFLWKRTTKFDDATWWLFRKGK